MEHLPIQVAVDMHFAELREKQKKDRKQIEMIFANDSAKELLPYEMWCYVVSFVVLPEYEAYLIFLRKDIFYQDTYYMFAGTQSKFKKSMAVLKKAADDTKMNSRAHEDEQLDTPVDTWCTIDHGDDGIICPDANGHKCCSHWVNYLSGSKEEFNRAYIAIDDFGADHANYRRREICNI